MSFVTLMLAGCATSEQWNTWRSHNSHFASGQHAMFSIRNPGDQAERVKVTDPTKSQAEAWWGRQLPMPATQASGK
jgi:hypothetical protein